MLVFISIPIPVFIPIFTPIPIPTPIFKLTTIPVYNIPSVLF